MAQSTVTSVTGSQIALLDLAVRSGPSQPPSRTALDVTAQGFERSSQSIVESESSIRHMLILAGAFAANFASFGWVVSSGFFFDYYRTQLFDNESQFALSWLNGLGFACLYAVSLPLAYYCSSSSFGPRSAIWLGAFLDLIGLCLLALATNLPEVLLLQAVISPLGASMVFNASITILSKWFRKNGIRAIAITATGSGIGGLLFPLLIHKLLTDIGYVRTILVCVVINLTSLSICCVTLKMPQGVRHEPHRINVLGLFAKTQFLATVIGSTFFVCGYYTTMGFLVAIAHDRGVPNPSLALSIASGSSIPGRLISGWIAQSRGVYNTLVVFTFAAWVLTVALFPYVTSLSATLAFCGLWGFFSSACISLLPAVIFSQSPLPEVSVRIGFAYSIMSIMVLIGSPVGATIVEAGGNKILITYCGILQATGWACWVLARYHETGLPYVDIV